MVMTKKIRLGSAYAPEESQLCYNEIQPRSHADVLAPSAVMPEHGMHSSYVLHVYSMHAN